MVRQPTNRGPRLEALLDERDHLRVQISLAKDEHSEEMAEKRRRLLELDRKIIRFWGDQGYRQ